ncbi:MAG: GH3 auxin-responsive promoter family protein [Lachnospiraceae bacterium]|nr:GH3 auxin-responsive promoter family protein [Lachnospiraceae bacterium]
MKKYAISVVTPAHNTDPEIFKECVASMKEQTIGFENVEWIVVLHNCDEEHESALKAFLSGYDNIKVSILHNDVHSPSSPRNHGLDLATADYVGLLDADDRYTPQCFAKVLNYMKETNADICQFRRQVELEQASDIVLNDLVNWDQTQETIIVNKDTWDSENFFVGLWGLCTHKIYRREFLNKNDIRFREEIPFGEDGDFTLKAYQLADRICLTPQFIGYVYYINSGSLAQTLVLDDERMINFAEGFAKFFERGKEYGINMNAAIAELLLFMALFINNSKDIKPETIARVKEVLGDYVREVKPIIPSKLYPVAKAEAMNTLPQLVLLGKEVEQMHYIYKGTVFAPQTFDDHQTDTLKRILSRGMNTDYGKHYHFDHIYMLEDYRESLPISNYDVYQPMVELIVHIAEENIFTSDEITSFAVFFSNLGVKKRLPVTDRSLKRYVKGFEALIGETRLFPMFESLPHNPTMKNMDTKYANTLTGLIQTEFLSRLMQKTGSKASIVTPMEILFPNELNNFEYVRFLFALRDKKLETIFAPNAWVLYSGIRLLKRDFKQLCEDIRNGSFVNSFGISEKLAQKISSRMTPSPERADELLKIFEEKGDDLTLKDLWPELSLVIADGTGSYKIYLDKSLRYLKGVKHHHGILADECCMYGVAENEAGCYKLDPSAGFYEFMPVYGGDPCFAYEAEEGEDYRIIVTTDTGLYRYKTNMYVRLLQKDENELVVKKICPVPHDESVMKGLREEDVYEAVCSAEKVFDVNFCDFSLIEEDNYGKYTLVVEPESDEDLDKAEEAGKELSALITESLRDKADDENIKVKAYICEPESFFLHRDMRMFKWDVLPDGVLPQHMVEYGFPRFFKGDTKW